VHDEEKTLRRGLQHWREKRLQEIERDIEEQIYIYGRAAFALKCAHETPEVFDEDFIKDLWDDLNSSAVELHRLEEESERLCTMDLPELITTVNREAATSQRNNKTEATGEPAAPSPKLQAAAADPHEVNASGRDDIRAQVDQILTAWRDIMGIELDPNRVELHLRALETWQQKWRKRREEKDGG
jgi:hypothetical protein